MKTMNAAYLKAIKTVLSKGAKANPRNQSVIELTRPYVFELESVGKQFNNVSTLQKPFHTRLRYAEAEYQWYLSGATRIDMLKTADGKSFEHLWKQYSDDGIHVNSAYGFYMFSQQIPLIPVNRPTRSPSLSFYYNQGVYIDTLKNGIAFYAHTQWMWALYKMLLDRDTRQAVININQPVHKAIKTKDFPCCICMMFSIRNDKLDLTTVFRSQDVDTGLRNDVYAMTRLQEKMVEDFNRTIDDHKNAGKRVKLGKYTNVTLNLHLYKNRWDAAQQM